MRFRDRARVGEEEELGAPLIVRAGLCHLEARVRRISIEAASEMRYGRDPRARATLEVTRALQSPATTTAPEWAGALVRDSYGSLMEDVAAEAVVAQLPLQQHEFPSEVGSVVVSGRTTPPGSAQNLGATFRAEGAPIRVGSAIIGRVKLTPKSMGIIGTFTQELFKRSTPNIETVIGDWMVTDTAWMLDGIFLGSAAGSETQPAGIAHNLDPSDTAASSGNGVNQITADIKGRVDQLLARGLGLRPVWIMNSLRAAHLALLRDASGVLAFPSMSAPEPTLAGYPVFAGLSVPSDVVYLIDAASIAFGGAAPVFSDTSVGTLHEESDPSAVAPIVSGAGALAAPTRELYQTACVAVRGLWSFDWSVFRVGAVQTITGVAW